jgi:hypothetical protein
MDLLYYGDNFDVLRRHVEDASVDSRLPRSAFYGHVGTRE